MSDDLPASEKFSRQKLSTADRLVPTPWYVVVVYFFGSLILGAQMISHAQPDWRLPLERELIKVGGTFQDTSYTGIGYRPYIFVDDSGTQHTLGCDPETRVVYCLKTAGTSVHALTGQHVVIGYFKVHTPWWKPRRVAYPEILMTVDAPGRSIISFATSDARIREFQSMQNSHYVFLILELAIPLFFIVTAVQIAVAKLKANRRGS